MGLSGLTNSSMFGLNTTGETQIICDINLRYVLNNNNNKIYF